MKDIIDLLHQSQSSCVIANNKEVRVFSNRGVKDLYDLLQKDAGFLKGASVADKIVGKAAATLMVLGGVNELYTDLISTPALQLLKSNGIDVSFDKEGAVILNRDQCDWCPLEILCYKENSTENNLPLIDGFIKQNMNRTKTA